LLEDSATCRWQHSAPDFAKTTRRRQTCHCACLRGKAQSSQGLSPWALTTNATSEANLQIGPTDQGQVRLFIEGKGEIPMDFEEMTKSQKKFGRCQGCPPRQDAKCRFD
jgi:hypothetical protein